MVYYEGRTSIMVYYQDRTSFRVYTEGALEEMVDALADVDVESRVHELQHHLFTKVRRLLAFRLETNTSLCVCTMMMTVLIDVSRIGWKQTHDIRSMKHVKTNTWYQEYESCENKHMISGVWNMWKQTHGIKSMKHVKTNTWYQEYESCENKHMISGVWIMIVLVGQCRGLFYQAIKVMYNPLAVKNNLCCSITSLCMKL